MTIKTTHVRAFLVTALSDSLIASISMYTANEQALDLTVEIRGDRPIDGPGELMASAVFPVGVGADWYTAEFDVPVRVKAGQRIWIAWNSVQGMLAPYAETGPRLRTLAYNSSDGEWHDFTRAPLLRATCCANGGVLDRGPGLAVCRPGSAQGQARHSLIRVRAGTRSLTASTRVPPTNSDSICPNNRQEHF